MSEYRKIITLSFDDGTVQDRRFIELIDRYGLKCTFNLNSGCFSTKHDIEHFGIVVCHDEVDADEVRGLYAGHEVAVHTLTHPDLTKCGDDEIVRQVEEDRLALERLTGAPVTGMAYPLGTWDKRVIGVLREKTGVRYARTVDQTLSFDMPHDFLCWRPTCHAISEHLFEVADSFAEAAPDKGDLLLYVWGHSFEFDKDDSWDRFERFCERISGLPDTEYMTNGQVMQYKTAGRMA